MNLFDTCIITASDEAQKKIFEELLQRRIDHGLYPREIEFKVYSDPESGRIGSGGGTIWAMHQYLKENNVDDIAGFLSGKRILMIHAGGESRRNPMYVPEGKLFTPIPVPTSSIYPPTVLDMQLTLFLKYPWKREGEIIVSSGDVVIDFDCHQIPRDRGDICGFTKPVSLKQGASHGVFQFDENKQHVTDYFQKESEKFLQENARLEGSEECALDMGIIAFSSHAMTSLLEYAAEDDGKETSLIRELQQGSASLDLYLEILTACLKDISFDEFLARISSRTTLHEDQLQQLFHVLNQFNLTGILTKKTTFLHFGTLDELPVSGLELHRKELLPFYASENDEVAPHFYQNQMIFNSDHVELNSRSMLYAESCSNIQLVNLGDNLFSGLENFQNEKEISQGICLDFRRIGAAEYFLIYGINDTFKPQDSMQEVIFCNTSIQDWLRERKLKAEDIFSDPADPDLLNAKLFAGNPSIDEIYGYFSSEFITDDWIEKFKAADRRSIREINNMDSAVERELRRIAFRKNQLRDQFQSFIGWRTISREDFLSTFKNADLEHLTRFYDRTEDNLLREYRHTLLNELSDETDLVSPSSGFEIEYVAEEPGSLTLKKSIKDDQIVWARSPVRLDLAGGWSDTPPYTLREGGQVTNLAVDLNGQPPIQVFCRPTTDQHIRLHSIDLGVTETVDSFDLVEDYNNPVSPFALPKAALTLLGMTKSEFQGKSLQDALDTIGCGLELTLLCAIPKGSGLGTSSVLAAAILSALHRFFGLEYTPDELYRQVLQMEQMLTTGGGWQDQIGGVAGGVKYIESHPGLKPEPVVHQLDPHLFVHPEFTGCYTLFYTGITRLAKNILQDVVDSSNARTPAYLFTLDYIRQLAVDARRAIALRDLPGVARIVNKSWEANKRIHPSSTNAEVEKILQGTKGLYTGMKLLGAGGGGYALFISENWQQAEQLREVLVNDFEDNKARIVNFNLNQPGLQVTVS